MHGLPALRGLRVAACVLLFSAFAATAFAQDGGAPPGPAAPPLRPVGFDVLPGWLSDAHAEILPALKASCAAIRSMRPETPLGGQGDALLRAGTAAAWQAICAELGALERSLPPAPRPARGPAHEHQVAVWLATRNGLVRDFIETRFEPFAAGTGIMTGYYEPVLRGAARPGGEFRIPLHARPPELVEAPVNGDPLRRRYGMQVEGRIEPFHDRAAIDTGALAGRGLELVWVDDPVEAFFLHIQGSGRVVLPDGQMLRIGYAGQNGRPYVSIGRLLIESGQIPRERMSMQAIRAWIAAAGPDRATELLRGNPRYVFFRRVDGLAPDQGPIGAMGVPLTPRRSVAVDRAFIPLGAPLFVGFREPGPARGADAPAMGRLVVAQDTGGAIRGPARTDFFWGWGAEAGERAGRMRDEAPVFVLLPRPVSITAPDSH